MTKRFPNVFLSTSSPADIETGIGDLDAKIVSGTIDFSMLSDGQKSLLYFSLVVAMHALGRKVLKKEIADFDVNRFKPAVFTLIALEEPENSLSPHYLGRIIKCLNKTVGAEDAQALVSTHSPSVLKRVAPERIRYFRLDAGRKASVTSIILPNSADEAHKFVREAVEAFPELYFSRIVILGEGDSEEVVLPRVLKLEGLEADDASISIVPLGGRHVNHFWRLLRGIDIPYVTLLDLDLARYQGGWGRIRYTVTQLLAFPPAGSTLTQANLDGIPVWNAPAQSFPGELGPQWTNYLEGQGVFFSNPLDLDFSMLQAFPNAYEAADHVAAEAPAESTIKSVLGKGHGNVAQYPAADLLLFDRYHALFKLGSKPVEQPVGSAPPGPSRPVVGISRFWLVGRGSVGTIRQGQRGENHVRSQEQGPRISYRRRHRYREPIILQLSRC